MTMRLFGKGPDVKQMQVNGDIDGLIKALRNFRAQVVVQAAQALGELKDARSIEPLIAALDDGSDEVRSAATSALSGMWNDRMGGAFVPLLSDKNAALAQKALAILDEKGWKPKNGEEMLCFLMAKDDWAGMAAHGQQPLRIFKAEAHADGQAEVFIPFGVLCAAQNLIGVTVFKVGVLDGLRLADTILYKQHVEMLVDGAVKKRFFVFLNKGAFYFRHQPDHDSIKICC